MRVCVCVQCIHQLYISLISWPFQDSWILQCSLLLCCLVFFVKNTEICKRNEIKKNCYRCFYSAIIRHIWGKKSQTYYMKSHVVSGKVQLFVWEMIETKHKRFPACEWQMWVEAEHTHFTWKILWLWQSDLLPKLCLKPLWATSLHRTHW